MITVQYHKQPGKISPLLVINVTSMADKAVLSAAYNESVINGRQFELISVVQDSDADAFVNSVIMGLAADVSFSGILSDTTFPGFFVPNRQYAYLMIYNSTAHVSQLSGGITPAGIELFSGVTIIANGWTAILINYPCSAVTNFFIHHSGSGDTWNGAILRIKTISDAL